jgi:hypothetical protein
LVAAGDRSQVINRGQVTVSGSFHTVVMAIGEDASALNRGVISITGESNVAMFGTDGSTDVTNSGVIRIAGDDGTGMVGFGDGHHVSNLGLVETHGTFSMGMAALPGGPFSGVDLEVLNSGLVSTEGDLAIGIAIGLRSLGFRPAIGAEVVNTGMVQAIGDGAAGVVLIGDEHHLVNSGSIVTKGAAADAGFADLSAAGVLVSGDGVLLENSGVIQSKNANSAAVELNVLERAGLPAAYMSSLLENSGWIKGAGLAILGGAGQETIVNHGLIVGDIDLGGGADMFTFAAGGVLIGELALGGGDDLVVIANGVGQVRVADFAAGISSGDAIDLSAFFSDFGALTAASSQHGNDVSIALDSNDSLMLLNVQLSALGAGDFWFV